MALHFTNAHFRANIAPVDMAAEVAQVAAKDDVRAFQPLPGPFIQQLEQHYPLVKRPQDLAELPPKLRGDREMGFCPLFCPAMVDATCQLGLFPLAIDVHRNVFVFAPKCHVQRGVTRLTPMEKIDGLRIADDGEGNFDPSKLSVASKLAKRCTVAVNQLDDLTDVLDLIHRQHGENWMCGRLRACFIHMLLNAANFKTRMVFLAVRDKATRALVASEFGYIVGDIYTSGTGAYCVSGAGTLQLQALASLLQELGVKIWDLGMVMDYKTKALGITAIARKPWLACVKQRLLVAGGPTVGERLAALSQRGCMPAEGLVRGQTAANPAAANPAAAAGVPPARPVADPQPTAGSAPAGPESAAGADVGAAATSKAQRKKLAKQQWLAAQKQAKGSGAPAPAAAPAVTAERPTTE
jgi:hypothetical protein